jgi:hypothetical protein
MAVDGQRHAPTDLPPGKTQYVPIVKEAGWAPGPVWTGAENVAPPGFDPRTVQPVASRCIDWAKGGANEFLDINRQSNYA